MLRTFDILKLGVVIGMVSAVALGSSGVLLECTGFEYDTLEKIQVTEAEPGVMVLTEFYSDGDRKFRSINPSQLEKGPIELPPLYGFTRKLVRNEEGVWMLEYGCGTQTPIQCKEEGKP